jgi:DNA-binding NtrC family response regulator
VEDEPLVCNVVTNILECGGYTVDCALTGAAAIAKIEDPDNDYALAILDFFLPDTTGVELLDAVYEHQPDIAVLMMSGFAQESDELSAVYELRLPFIQKPFSARKFIESVTDTIQKGPRGRNVNACQ